MKTFNLRDTFHIFFRSLKRYSWWRKAPLCQARLGYFQVSHPVHDIIASCNININLSYRSDHSIVGMKILLNKSKHGKRIWKFNCSLLKDNTYISLVTKIVQEEKIKYVLPVHDLDYMSNISDDDVVLAINDGQFLELVLYQIQGETIKYGLYSKKKR